ncbi:pseudouridine synthase [Erysipelothrix larvae]|uniref:Pseudouridine synthase n=1 Tax=Erysipelothrix larvae TaxID=1514105 RepID=A0A120JTT2_9FIRM|nr:RluA family pseudouridine synthase [Erysipelothrix larvae]AMC93870.1 pseudouridine synthase [Erysipelothrix larvae]
MIKLIVELEYDNERLDVFLAQMVENTSRSVIQSWIKKGNVNVNGSPSKANTRLREGDVVQFHVEVVDTTLAPVNMDLDIVYEDDHLLIINKPRDMVVHPSMTTLDRPTLVHGLLAYTDQLSDINGELRPGIVHRIDKDTSGLLVVAKTNEAHEKLVEDLKEHLIKREYMALVHHVMEHQSILVDAPIGRDPKHRQRMAVTDVNSKPATTRMFVIENYAQEDMSLIRCELETGRTHQIRVHCKYINHPIVGDKTYSYRNTPDIGGQWLHAYALTLNHPITGEPLHFEVEIPHQLQAFLDTVRGDV